MGSTNESKKKNVDKDVPKTLETELVTNNSKPLTTEQALEEILANEGKDFNEEEKVLAKELGTKMLGQSMSPKDAMGITNDMLEGIYSFGYRLYNNGKYNDAAPIFRLLVLLDPGQAKYLMGLAACFHMCKDYLSASTTYSLCSLIDLDDPLPFYHASDCYLQLGEQETALKCLEISIAKMENRPQYAVLQERARLNYEALKEGLSWNSAEQEKVSEKPGDNKSARKTA